MAEPYDLTATEAAEQIRQRKLSPVALVESLLARTEALEPSLQVWVTLDAEGALESAREAERELDRSGPRGPLHGVPAGLKDIYHTKGMKTTACSVIYKDFVPDYDSTAVAKLREAGAIIMGKTVTTEFALGDPSPTHNPWDAAHTPGGSSSGSAVGVAARMVPLSLGTQTGGSMLRPAAYNGVVGLKPSFGRISRYGVIPVSWSLDHVGIFARSVEDTALALGVLAGHDPSDFSTSPTPVPDYLAALATRNSPPRIGFVRKFFMEVCDAEVRDNTDRAAARLEEAGAVVKEVSVPTNFDTLLDAHRVVMTVEAAAVHEADFSVRPDDFSPYVRDAIEAGLITPAVTYVQAQRIRRRFQRDMLEAVQDFDVLLTPSTPAPAPRDLSTTGDPRFQSPWTNCGFPAMTIPSGLSRSGLPMGIQMAAAPFDEEALLAAAHWSEQVLDVSLAPPVAA